jgi:hypothetical protein
MWTKRASRLSWAAAFAVLAACGSPEVVPPPPPPPPPAPPPAPDVIVVGRTDRLTPGGPDGWRTLNPVNCNAGFPAGLSSASARIDKAGGTVTLPVGGSPNQYWAQLTVHEGTVATPTTFTIAPVRIDGRNYRRFEITAEPQPAWPADRPNVSLEVTVRGCPGLNPDSVWIVRLSENNQGVPFPARFTRPDYLTVDLENLSGYVVAN